ncbi:hypothetical protein ACTFIZ_009235 [Dictyostelium cf. discoideum]
MSSNSIFERILSQDGLYLNKECKKGKKFGDYEIEYCETLAVWLALTHWWVLIKTKNGYYFILSCNYDSIYLIPCRDCDDARRLGQCGGAGVDYEDSKNISLKEWWVPKYIKTIGDVYKWATKQDFNYHLLKKNCKHICEQLYKDS